MTWIAREKDDWYSKSGTSVPLVIKILLCRGHTLVSIHIGHGYFPVFCLLQKVYTDNSSQISLSPVLQWYSFQILDHSDKSLVMANKSVYIHTSCLFSFKVNNQAHCPKFCPLKTSSLWKNGSVPSTLHQGCPRKGLELSTRAVHFWAYVSFSISQWSHAGLQTQENQWCEFQFKSEFLRTRNTESRVLTAESEGSQVRLLCAFRQLGRKRSSSAFLSCANPQWIG